MKTRMAQLMGLTLRSWHSDSRSCSACDGGPVPALSQPPRGPCFTFRPVQAPIPAPRTQPRAALAAAPPAARLQPFHLLSPQRRLLQPEHLALLHHALRRQPSRLQARTALGVGV
jgi:hypothetical protein